MGCASQVKQLRTKKDQPMPAGAPGLADFLMDDFVQIIFRFIARIE
jgi:hypothetical protein